MEVQAHTLFESDAVGRLSRLRESGGQPAPRFFLGRTRHGNLWRFGADLPSSGVRELARLAAREGPLPRDAEPPPPERCEPFRRALADLGIAIESEWRGPAYRFPSESATSPAADLESVHLVSAAHLDPLRAHFGWLRDEFVHRSPVFAWIDAGEAIGVCFAARRVVGVAAEAGVETWEPARGRGIASALVRRWAQELVSLGEAPLYSTSWGNRASLAVARRLQLVRYGEDYHLT